MSRQLAVDGAPPTRATPFPAWPHFPKEEIDAVAAVLASGRVNQWTGSEVRAFEAEYAAKLGVRHAVAVANGTLALEIALRAAGVGPGDEVVVPARTFVATASAAWMVGATPVCCDVDPVSGNLTAATVEAVLTPRTKAVIPVHLAGWPVDMDPLMDLARRVGLFVLEDCAQAHGATYKGRPVGTLGDVGSFSFCQDKILTTGGEGGLLVTDEARLGELVWSLKDHGKDPAAVARKDHPPGFRWLHARFGTNARMTEMQAAIGRLQLADLHARVARRRRNAARLSQGLEHARALALPRPPATVEHAYYRYQLEVVPEALAAGWDRDRVMQAIEREGVPCTVGSCSEIYLERAFAEHGVAPPGRLPNARRFTETSLMLPVHHRLSDGDVDDVVAAVTRVMAEASSRLPAV